MEITEICDAIKDKVSILNSAKAKIFWNNKIKNVQNLKSLQHNIYNVQDTIKNYFVNEEIWKCDPMSGGNSINRDWFPGNIDAIVSWQEF